MSPAAYRGRFAPSPTGPLHFGSLVAALGSWLDARHHGGRWLVRIEDIDPPREREGATEAQLASLAAHGLHADEPVLRQSTRGAAYAAAVDDLLLRDLAFPCRCSRRDLVPTGGIHRACVAKPSGRQAAIRLRAPVGRIDYVDRRLGPQSQDVSADAGDVVLRRADGLWAYQLAVVVDDAAQGITDVVRGADLAASTPRQIALQQALGLPTPRYLHLPLVLDEAGHKLSKSLAAMPVDGGDPQASLQAAWRFLLPAVAPPARLPAAEAWLAAAAQLYRPDALRRADAPLDAASAV